MDFCGIITKERESKMSSCDNILDKVMVIHCAGQDFVLRTNVCREVFIEFYKQFVTKYKFDIMKSAEYDYDTNRFYILKKDWKKLVDFVDFEPLATETISDFTISSTRLVEIILFCVKKIEPSCEFEFDIMKDVEVFIPVNTF